jgi:hypothetical protein
MSTVENMILVDPSESGTRVFHNCHHDGLLVSSILLRMFPARDLSKAWAYAETMAARHGYELDQETP